MSQLVPHPDGTIFAVTSGGGVPEAVIGIDPTTGGAKFIVPVPTPPGDPDGISNAGPCPGSMIIAGDGYAYLPFGWMSDPGLFHISYHLRVLRVNSAGASDVIQINDWVGAFTEICGLHPQIITNADTGTLLTWDTDLLQPSAAWRSRPVPAQAWSTRREIPGGGLVVPVLQAQDGSFVGTTADSTQNYMIAFDASGGVRWSVAGDYQPQIATDDGGVIATDDNGSVFTFGGDGSATGQMASLPTYSWAQQWYGSASGGVTAIVHLYDLVGVGYWGATGGNPSSNGAAVGVAVPVESVPVFALPLRGGPNCQLGGAKVALSGDSLQQYNDKKQELLAGNYLTSPTCSDFFSVAPRIGYFNQLVDGINRQLSI